MKIKNNINTLCIIRRTYPALITLCNVFAIIFWVVMLLCSGCSDKILVKQDFDFEIKNLPYKTTVKKGDVVEIRFEITSIEGQYTGTKYYLRYFQSEGEGFFQNEDGTVFIMNDEYELPNKKFRLYFLPSTSGSHSLDVVFYDNFNHEKEVNITVSTEEEVTE